MRVQVRLFFHLRRHAPGQGGELVLDLAPEAKVSQALAALDIPELPPKVLLVNGRQSSLATTLREGDALVVFPPVEGG